MREYIFDGRTIHTLDDWWDAWQSVVRGPEWEQFGRNRDAYRDSINGGPCAPELPCRIVIDNSASLVKNLSIDQTRNELMKSKEHAHSSWQRIIDEQLRHLEFGRGELAHNWVIDPLIGAPGIQLVFNSGNDDDISR